MIKVRLRTATFLPHWPTQYLRTARCLNLCGVKFAQQSTTESNLVRAYAPGEIAVGEHRIRRSVILTAQEIIFDWPPRHIGELTLGHLDAALGLKPELIVLGTGVRQQFPDMAILRAVQRSGVGIEVMDTQAACRTYNILLQESRRVAAALIVEYSGSDS